jgi:hypothetical protein
MSPRYAKKLLGIIEDAFEEERAEKRSLEALVEAMIAEREQKAL